MVDTLNGIGQQDGGDIQSLISQLSEHQLNELYNHLYSLRSILADISPESLKTISEGRIDLPSIDQIVRLLEKTEKLSQSETMNDQNIQSLLSAFCMNDLVDALKGEQIRHDSYKGLSDEDLMPF